MDVTPFVENLRRALAAAAAVADPETRAAVENLTTALDSAVRLTLIDALSAAADEVTGKLTQGSVEVRIRNRELDFVVTSPASSDAFVPPLPPLPPMPPAPPEPPSFPGDVGTARITLRLPEPLKGRIEEVSGLEGVSVNAWLVRAVSAALMQSPSSPHTPRSPGSGKRISGWAR